jgi:hypothetical protein
VTAEELLCGGARGGSPGAAERAEARPARGKRRWRPGAAQLGGVRRHLLGDEAMGEAGPAAEKPGDGAQHQQ